MLKNRQWGPRKKAFHMARAWKSKRILEHNYKTIVNAFVYQCIYFYTTNEFKYKQIKLCRPILSFLENLFITIKTLLLFILCVVKE